jgi:hypothetical protein
MKKILILLVSCLLPHMATADIFSTLNQKFAPWVSGSGHPALRATH